MASYSSKRVRIVNPDGSPYTSANRARRLVKSGVAKWSIEGVSILIIRVSPEAEVRRTRRLAKPSFFWPAGLKVVSAEQALPHDASIDLHPVCPVFRPQKKKGK